MAQEKLDLSNPEHFALLGETNAKLKARGYTDEAIKELRAAQQAAPPARSAEEYAAATKSRQSAQPAKADQK